MDWKLLLSQLRSHGLSQQDIADFCGCGQSTISELASGKTKQPSYSLGVSILELHKKHKRRANVGIGAPVFQDVLKDMGINP